MPLHASLLPAPAHPNAELQKEKKKKENKPSSGHLPKRQRGQKHKTEPGHADVALIYEQTR